MVVYRLQVEHHTNTFSQIEQQKHIHSDISVNCKYTCMYFGFLFFHLFHFAIPASHSFLYFPCLFPLVFCNTTSNRTTPHPSIYTPPLLFVRLLDCFVFFPCSSYTVCLLISWFQFSCFLTLHTSLSTLLPFDLFDCSLNVALCLELVNAFRRDEWKPVHDSKRAS